MNGKGDDEEEKDNSLSDSKELFDRIFKEATLEIKKENREQKGSFQIAAAPAPGRGRDQTKTSEKERIAAKPTGHAPRKPETGQTNARSKAEKQESTPLPRGTPKTEKKNVKRSVALRAAVLLILLAILAAAVSISMGIMDFSSLLGYFGSSHEQVTKAPVPTKQPVKLAEKAVASPRPPQEQVSTPAPAPSKPTPSAISKEDKLAELETPTTIAKAKAGKERVEEKAPSLPTTDKPKSQDVAVTQEPQPVPVHAQASAKPGAEAASSGPRTPQYPYSVYLGSFKTSEAVNKALIEFQEKGLSPYWAKVDLGDKGVWFRFFAGYFKTKEEAEQFIRDRNIQGASLGITRYANLIGIYSSDKEVEDNKRALVSAGFHPYVLKSPDGKRFLYSGAFDRKEFAENERTVLASKGIKSETTER